MGMEKTPPQITVKSSHKVGTDLPKADMHVHISLALSPEVFLRRIKFFYVALKMAERGLAQNFWWSVSIAITQP